jgi:hypothetical protein
MRPVRASGTRSVSDAARIADLIVDLASSVVRAMPSGWAGARSLI